MTEPKDVVKTNAPRIIYLQDGGGEPLPRERYDEQVTWCEGSIEDDDTKYIRFDEYERDLTAARAALSVAEKSARDWEATCKSICDEWNEDCEDECDSYAHEQNCAATSIIEAMKQRRVRAEKAEAALKEAEESEMAAYAAIKLHLDAKEAAEAALAAAKGLFADRMNEMSQQVDDTRRERNAAYRKLAERAVFDLGQYVNATDISAADMPHTVVKKLQAAIDSALAATKGGANHG